MPGRVISSLGPGLCCPECTAPESHPREEGKILIRAFKVSDKEGRWWSQCLVCSGFYKDLKTLELQPEKHDKDKGWFCSGI